MDRRICLIMSLLLSGLIFGTKPAMASDLRPVINLMTLNLHNAKDAAGRSSLQSFAALIEETAPDIVGLQEVQPNQLKRLSLDGYQWAAGSNANLLTFRFGNAILVRGTIVYHRHHYLPGQLEQRGLDEVGVDVKGKQFVVFITHLGLSGKERAQQLETIYQLIKDTPYPVILLGDFNTSPDDPVFGDLSKALRIVQTERASVFTYPAAAPKHAIDQIWISREFAVKSSGALAFDGSDHLPFWAQLTVDTPFRSITPPPSVKPRLESFSAYHSRLVPEIQVGLSLDSEGKDRWASALSVPFNNQTFIYSSYSDEKPLVGIGWASKPTDLRDYLSLIKIKGTGQWNLMAAWSPDDDPWLVWEQNYQWNPRWSTRLSLETGGPRASWEISQAYGISDKINAFISGDADARLSMGFYLSVNAHQRIMVSYQTVDDVSEWAFTWSVF